MSVETGSSVGVTEPNVIYVNEAGVTEDVVETLRDNRDIANAIEQWSQSLRLDHPNQNIDVFARSRWKDVKHIFSQFSMCSWAVENDDILCTLADVTEALAFQKSSGRSCRFELNDDTQEDLWNMWAEDVDLDGRIREIFRELFKVSQCTVGVFWQPRSYVVDPPPIPGSGMKRRRKTYQVVVPVKLTILDPTKVVPVGGLLFGQERIAYIADDVEHDQFTRIFSGQVADPKVLQMLEGPYGQLTQADLNLCGELGIAANRLWLMRDTSVFRHTLTRASYERFAVPRLRPALETLHMKAALRSSDRATLQGNANFIVVITKGTDKHPAKQAEIDNLKASARVIAKLPVLVGDHRLNVEIVAPPLDNTLIESRWQVLDSRLVFQALQSFQPIVQGGNSSGSGVSEMSRVVSAGIENRRAGIARSLEQNILGMMLEVNPQLSEKPRLTFAPKHVSLDFRNEVINTILKIRDRGDISRETVLEELDFSQDVEARRRAREREAYDETFQSGTAYSSPVTNPHAEGPSIEGGRPPGATTNTDANGDKKV